jgi:hypothetical protein
MRRTFRSVAVTIGLFGVALGAAGMVRQTDPPRRAWEPGSCYRVFRVGEKIPDSLKVVSVDGPWIRVESDPRAPWVPGARQQAWVWVNADAVSIVQEWPCSSLPWEP